MRRLPLVLLALAGCHTGPSARTFAPAQGPEGVQADLRVQGAPRVRGELLEVQDSALLVRTGNRIALVSLRAIRLGRFRQRGTLIERGRITPGGRERLRAVCRFPAGLTPELRARLLEAHGQSAPDRVGTWGPGPADTALAGFAARARAGTERYRDPRAARAAGYRPVGPDFPGMGRHWVHPALILRETPDAAHPPILEYAGIAGRETLVGVAYGVLVRADGAPPAQPPVPADAWHFHQGTVTEESFVRSHAGLGVGHGAPEKTARIAVLHAWVWLDNPDGLLATDNWALPFARLGLAVPADAPRDAARALALAAGESGREYVGALLRAVGEPSGDEAAALADVVARHGAAARSLVAGGGLPLEALAGCWAALWDDVRAAVRPGVWHRLAAVR